ncbi:MAG: nucleotidyltransferase domain-containing protein [Methanofastidiosum sp.]
MELFGSYSRKEQKESSYIDILVEFNKSTFDNYMGLIFYLEELFGKKLI